MKLLKYYLTLLYPLMLSCSTIVTSANLGLVEDLCKEGKYEEALEAINAEIEKDSNDVFADKKYLLRSIVYFGLDSFSLSENDLNIAVSKADNDTTSLYLIQSDFSKLENDSTKLAEILYRTGSRHKLTKWQLEAANIYNNLSKYTKAKEIAQTILKDMPNDPQTLDLLGYSEWKLGYKSNAKKHFQAAIDLGYKKACYHLREMTAITKYYKKYYCCDGSEAKSIGKGACSHHGGLCNTKNIPYQEYTMTADCIKK